MHRKHRVLSVLAAAALLLGACAENDPLGVESRPESRPEAAAPQRATAPVGPRWSIFTWQEPTEYLDAAPGWEVSTRFSSTKSGKIHGLWFWRAPGETGTNTGRLWTDGGQQLAAADFPSGQSGWVYAQLGSPVAVAANTYYRVSVNTNTKQAKWPAGFNSIGSAGTGPLSATGSHYGQPMGSMAGSGSSSIFFTDVDFEEDVPLPNLYIAAVNPTLKNFYGQEIVLIRVCNNGAAAAAATWTRFGHYNPSTGSYNSDLYTPAIGAGSCYDHAPVFSSPLGGNEYHIWADYYDAVYEPNENNYHFSTWNRMYY
jgi:hypothetical protein